MARTPARLRGPPSPPLGKSSIVIATSRPEGIGVSCMTMHASRTHRGLMREG